MAKLFDLIVAHKLRKEWKANDDRRDRGFSIPDSVEVIKDISYGPHGKWNLMDINRPKNASGKLPCIVSFHGGGFFYGTKETYQFYAADLAGRGFVVFNFNYRLSPENNFPCQLEDCNAVLRWIENNGDRVNVDTDRIFFVGDSAGGNLVYNYTEMLTNKEYGQMFDFSLTTLKPKAVAMNCAAYWLGIDGNQKMRKAYIGSSKKYLEHLEFEKFLTKDFPPSFMMSSSNDFLLPQLQPAVDLFKSKGIEVVSKVYGKKEDPAASHVFHINLALEIAKECNDDECNFFLSRK